MSGVSERNILDALLVKVGARDRAAFEELYRLVSPKLYSVLIRILQVEAEASDVLQDVFIVIWNRAERFDPQRGRAMSWLAIITRNAGIDALRRRRPGQLSEDFCDYREAVDPSPFDDVLKKNTSFTLRKRLNQLPDNQRRAIQLFYLQEKSLVHVAETMNAPLNTVKSWVRRGVANLKNEFSNHSLNELI